MAKPACIAGLPAERGQPGHGAPARPAERPLDSPRAPLHRRGVPLSRPSRGGLAQAVRVGLARLFCVVVTLSLSAYGVYEMHGVISVGGTTPLQYAFLSLFAVNFVWICFAFSQALLGFVSQTVMAVRPRGPQERPVALKTAVLVPIYNEAPERVRAAIATMANRLAEAAPDRFAVFILSDTTRPDAWLGEEAALKPLIESAPVGCPIYYRHRAVNTERKAGNVADWVERWGAGYEAMLPLDADSLMDEDTILALSARLEIRADLGLIQTLPRIIRARSLFARLQQFANRCYGPIYGSGLATWHGRSSNYWGHNAIIRTQAFADAARLPVLEGPPPFGGHIMSHDFVEAALLRRAGWGVRLDADLAGTYEETPPSLTDVLVRDRRWAQGNLQHSRLIFARGLTMATRLHLLTGILSYCSALLWFLLILVGLALAFQAQTLRPEYFTEPSLFPQWPVFDSERAVALFVAAMGVVLGPKLLGWLSACLRTRTCFGFAGPFFLTISTLMEILFSALYAPVMMFAQTRIVMSIFAGRAADWTPQRRDGGSIPLPDLIRAHGPDMLCGAALALAAWFINPDLFWWLAPVTAGLILAVPLSAASGTDLPGRVMRALWIWRTPEEGRPPAILKDFETRLTDIAPGTDAPETLDDGQGVLLRLRRDHDLAAWHLAQLPAPEDIDERLASDDTLTALGKMEREADPGALEAWLTRAQLMALLSHPRLAECLPNAAPAPTPASDEEPRMESQTLTENQTLSERRALCDTQSRGRSTSCVH